MNYCRFLPAALLLAALAVVPSAAQKLPTIEAKTAGLLRQEGYFPLYWSDSTGILWLEVPADRGEFLYVVSLPAGLGSNDVGLDRGQLSGERVVRFERVGPRLLLTEENLRFRAESENPYERQSVRDAFAGSVVWGFPILAETPAPGGAGPGRVLVDATDFIVRDAHGVIRALQQTGQGSFRLDRERSALFPEMLKTFPENTEMEARLTFGTDSPGRFVQEVAADPYAVTLRIRHSFVKLPPPGYAPRELDPRSGYFGVSYVDYATPIGEEMTKRFIARHRLEKRDPSATVSEPVEPIVYYLDPGTPEPVRGALLEGARWWNEAFEAAGYRNAFRVEMLPEEADAQDVRYNTIQWVHRSTRGWSYGSSVTDPRTGEIIKGHVTLGSLRVRQDYLLAEGLLLPYTGANASGFPAAHDPMLRMALARIRQLSAHEVGHTLGIAHNFAASVNGRASVMDYPAPLAMLRPDGAISLDEAYDEGIGDWDKLAIRYGYAEFGSPGREADSLDAVIGEMKRRGLLYVTDTDARAPGGSHPDAHLWDNGSGAIENLANEMAVRRIALARFGEAAVREGRPLATLEEVLVPLYLRHRYALEAAVKLVGGVEYSYALRGNAQPSTSPVPAAMQLRALDSLLASVSPAELSLPVALRNAIPPRPPGYAPSQELFGGHTGLTFDPYAPAASAAAMVTGLLLNPERAARLIYQHDQDQSLPDLRSVLRRMTDRTWKESVQRDPYEAEIQRAVQTTWANELINLSTRKDAAPSVRAQTLQHLRELHEWLTQRPNVDHETDAHRAYVRDEIDRFLRRDFRPEERAEPLPIPPGAPIGQD